jgi:hypothetical protein
MSWTDKEALKTIKKLKKEFNVNTFVETGTFKGINSFVHAKNFKHVITCENNIDYIVNARSRLDRFQNVRVVKQNSPYFLEDFKTMYKKNKLKDFVIFYLDAHFYNPGAKEKFVVKQELDSLEHFPNAIIIIHDFDNGMGHITYEGQPLNMELLRDRLKKVNRRFKFYTNTEEFSEIYTEETLKEIGLEKDPEALDNIKYAWSNQRLTKRGILYCVPRKLNLKKYKLIEWK